MEDTNNKNQFPVITNFMEYLDFYDKCVTPLLNSANDNLEQGILADSYCDWMMQKSSLKHDYFTQYPENIKHTCHDGIVAIRQHMENQIYREDKLVDILLHMMRRMSLKIETLEKQGSDSIYKAKLEQIQEILNK